MSTTAILVWSLLIAHVLLAIALACQAIRFIRGPRAQDRVVAFDAFYITSMLLMLTFGIRTGTTLYFEAALVISVLGFASTVARTGGFEASTQASQTAFSAPKWAISLR